MTDEKDPIENEPDFSAVDAGPQASDAMQADSNATAVSLDGSGHPSVDALLEEFGPDVVTGHEISAGDQHIVFIKDTENVKVLEWLKTTPAHHFDLLADVSAVDFGGGRPLQLHYQLWSITHRRALRVKCELPLNALEISSVAGLWKCADWLEREVYDMFGISFAGHPDLRRILMPENYEEGYPLRKDFPLRGRFSRSEQTRRALSQEIEDSYIPAELAIGGTPALVEGPEGGENE